MGGSIQRIPDYDTHMPIECDQLNGQPVKLDRCPQCGDSPFDPFMRGQVQRSRRWFWIGPRRDYCALICWKCKEIVGYESPKPAPHDDPSYQALVAELALECRCTPLENRPCDGLLAGGPCDDLHTDRRDNED